MTIYRFVTSEGQYLSPANVMSAPDPISARKMFHIAYDNQDESYLYLPQEIKTDELYSGLSVLMWANRSPRTGSTSTAEYLFDEKRMILCCKQSYSYRYVASTTMTIDRAMSVCGLLSGSEFGHREEIKTWVHNETDLDINPLGEWSFHFDPYMGSGSIQFSNESDCLAMKLSQ